MIESTGRSRATAIATPPTGACRVACSHCDAAVGTPCTTLAGSRIRGSHQERWIHYTRRLNERAFIIRVRDDDPDLGLTAGDRYTATTYPLDPGKITLLARLEDGHDPRCNQYWDLVDWEAWAD